MAKAGKIEVEYVFISKDELRTIIREEIAKGCRYSSPVTFPDGSPSQPFEWWQDPVINCGTASSVPLDANQIVINANQDRDYPNVTYSDDRGTL